MNSNSRRHGRQGWSVFDMIKPFPPTPAPETLIPDIDAAIAASEHAHSSSLLLLLLQSSNDNNLIRLDDGNNADEVVNHDCRLADEAYKSASAALASGRHDAAATSMKVAIAGFPPNKTSAMPKLKSLLDTAQSQLDIRNHKQ